MKVEKITEKTITITADPGDRICVDSQGFGYNRITLKFSGDEKLRNNMISAVNDNKKYKTIETQQRREYLLNECLGLPVFKGDKVFLGFNY